MKLIRFGNAGKEKPGIMTDEKTIIDISAFGEDYDENFFGSDGINRLKKWLKENQSKCPKANQDSRIGPVVKRPSKIICVGLNYKKHAEETGAELPKEPVLFFKATSALVGPNDNLIIPKGSKKTDWEVELAVVISKAARYVDEANAMEHVAGYVLHNDYSEREHQLERCGQWVKGKSADTFAPLGPFIATTDEITDPHKLNLWLKVNGKMVQNSNTNDLAFGVPYLVSYISQFMTLLPGDVISTGTPAGVGLGMNPPVYLKHGDVVELGIDGLGTSKQHVKEYEKS
jgi:2,4-didehydro-3-deoxy-L-rhamnonate hydrolase